MRILGELLAAYEDWRALTFRRIRDEQSAKSQEDENAERAGLLQQKFGSVADMLARVMQDNPYSHWSQVPGWFARAVVERDIIPFTTDEKGPVWVNAKHIAVSRLPTMLMAATTEPARWRIADIQDQVKNDPDTFPEALKDEAKVIYAQLLVFSRLPEKSTQS